MRWVLGIAGVLVLVVVVVAAIGLVLPKGHVASAAARYRASPDTVWAALTDVPGLASWRADLTKVETLPDRDGRRAWRETGKDGTVTYETVETDPPRRLVTRIADTGLPFGGSWTYELTPVDGGTRLTITERGEVYNPIFRFMARFVFGYTATMTGVLQSLGRKFGEDVRPEPSAAA